MLISLAFTVMFVLLEGGIECGTLPGNQPALSVKGTRNIANLTICGYDELGRPGLDWPTQSTGYIIFHNQNHRATCFAGR
jgi:hypothetical protein